MTPLDLIVIAVAVALAVFPWRWLLAGLFSYLE